MNWRYSAFTTGISRYSPMMLQMDMANSAASEKSMYQIEDTAFSSVTINRNFRTAMHMDDGDFKEGYGNLSVIERGKYSGGATIFPRYGVGFNVRTGDFLAMDVHEWQC